MKNLKVNVSLKTFEGVIENREIILLIGKDDNLDESLQMIFGCWFHILEYTTEILENYVYISKNYIKEYDRN